LVARGTDDNKLVEVEKVVIGELQEDLAEGGVGTVRSLGVKKDKNIILLGAG
jgi:hypothetical protein